VLERCRCEVCGGPHDYLYLNDGQKGTQYRCKVCSHIGVIEQPAVLPPRVSTAPTAVQASTSGRTVSRRRSTSVETTAVASTWQTSPGSRRRNGRPGRPTGTTRTTSYATSTASTTSTGRRSNADGWRIRRPDRWRPSAVPRTRWGWGCPCSTTSGSVSARRGTCIAKKGHGTFSACSDTGAPDWQNAEFPKN